MKKYLFVAILAVISVMAYAQPRAIGGRLGYGAEFSYEHTMDEKNMVSLEVGVPGFSSLEVACTYDWIDPFNAVVPWNEKGEWHWYMGVGGALVSGFQFNAIGAGVCGRFGIEYDFWFPLQLSIDFRPTIGAVVGRDANGNVAAAAAYDLYHAGLGLGVRYKF